MRIRILVILCFIFKVLFPQYIQECGTWNRTLFPSVNTFEKFEHGDWILVLNEDFDGPINKELWYTCYDGWNRCHGEDELQYYSDENVLIDNGVLRLQAKREPGYYPVVQFVDGMAQQIDSFFEYTSGMLQTKTQFEYGFFEIKCKIPTGQGLWPAFWLFGNEGEIDVFEFNCSEPNKHHITIHSWPTEGNHDYCATSWSNNTSFSDDYHVYSLEWNEFKLVFRVDGVIKRIDYRYKDLNNHYVEDYYHFQEYCIYWENPFFPTHAQSLYINLAIPSDNNGTYGPAPNSQTSFPCSFDVDYVRVYKRKNPYRDIGISSFDEKESDYFTGKTISTIESEPCFGISDNERKNFIACDSIVLKPCFYVEEGASFNARIATGTRNLPLVVLTEGSGIENADTDPLSTTRIEEPIGKNIDEGRDFLPELVPSSNVSAYTNHEIFSVFPNPSTGCFQIKLLVAPELINNLQIVDCRGNEVFFINNPTEQVNNVCINYQKGVFFVKCSAFSRTEVKKLIIQ